MLIKEHLENTLKFKEKDKYRLLFHYLDNITDDI